MIDRDSPVPYYLQLKGELESGIDAGKWGAGEMLPSEAQLCEQYRVSRTVVRQALNEMSYEGLVVRQKGKGTFVAQPKISSRSLVHSLEGFYRDMAERGVSVENQVLEQTLVPADEQVTERLELDPLAAVVKLVRLRFVEGEPIVLVTAYVPHELCRDLIHADVAQRSLYGFLEEECGLTISRGLRQVEAVAAADYEAEQLGVELGAPLIRLRSVSYMADDTPLEYFDAHFRGDRSRFEIELMGIGGHGSDA